MRYGDEDDETFAKTYRTCDEMMMMMKMMKLLQKLTGRVIR